MQYPVGRALLRSAFCALIVSAFIGGGCQNPGGFGGSFDTFGDADWGDEGERHETAPEHPRKLTIRSATQVLEVSDPVASTDQVQTLILECGGRIESIRTQDTYSYLDLRVPSAGLTATLDRLAELGKETNRFLSERDVTGQVIDLEATLANKRALRDRLRQLLERADSVKDVLAVETELTRLQTELDAADARLGVLRGQVAMARVDLTLQQRRILGPLGMVLKAVGWGLEKLFVIR